MTERYVVRHSLDHGWYVYDRERGAACERFPSYDRSSQAQFNAANDRAEALEREERTS